MSNTNYVGRVGSIVLDEGFYQSLVVTNKRAGMKVSEVWESFWVGNSPKPVVVKIKFDQLAELEAGDEVVFDMLVTEHLKGDPKRPSEAATTFYEVKLFPAREPQEVAGVLKLHTEPRDVNKDIRLGGVPVFELRFAGKTEDCALYVEPAGLDQPFEPFVVARDRQVLLEADALIMVQGEEFDVQGGVAIRIAPVDEEGHSLMVYDRRSDRETPYGKVEHIRDGQKTFYNINDLDGGVDWVAYMLTQEGLQPLNSPMKIQMEEK